VKLFYYESVAEMDEELRARLRDKREPICLPNETAPDAMYLSQKPGGGQDHKDSYFILSKVSLLPSPTRNRSTPLSRPTHP
jgi:hypothetical protein